MRNGNLVLGFLLDFFAFGQSSAVQMDFREYVTISVTFLGDDAAGGPGADDKNSTHMFPS
jgi:hypothetical protein